MRRLLFFIALCTGLLAGNAKAKQEVVKAVDLPKEIFTGENLKTEADLRRLIESIKIAPHGAVFSKEQLKGMEDILTALLKVAMSEKIESVHFSASSDLFATLDSTLGAKKEWQKIRTVARSDNRLVDLAGVITAMKASK